MTGVLPVTLEEGTKVVQALLHSGKEYVCVMKLHGDVPEPRLKQVLGEFENEIYQRPPLRASVKRQLRTRRIYYLDLLEVDGRNILFRVGCEGGTYIRKLCFDVGEVLGCAAHMQELRRTRAGPLLEGDSVILHDAAYWFMQWEETKDDKLLKRFVRPMENALALVPKVYVRDSAVDAICHGACLTAPGILSFEDSLHKDSLAAVMTLKGEAVALGKATVGAEEALGMEHGIVATTERVIMPRSTYPKRWKSSAKDNER